MTPFPDIARDGGMMGSDKDRLAEGIMGRKVVKLPTPEEPGLTDYDRDVIGRASVRIDIPFCINPFRFRQIADLLRGLAADLDFLSRELPPVTDKEYDRRRRVLLVDLGMRARVVAKRIISLRE